MSTPQPLRNVPLAESNRILAKVRERDPDHIYAAVSGGEDSVTAFHVARQSDEIQLDGVVHVDTGISINASTEYVREVCDQYDVDLTVLDDSNSRFQKERYGTLVRQFGFPGATPIAHNQMFQNLKEKPISSRFVSSLDGDIVLISGVRKHESQRRFEHLRGSDGMEEQGSILWASPLLSWTDQNVDDYLEFFDVERPGVEAKLCISGECLCGCFSDRRDFPLIETFYPQVAMQIKQLEWDVLERAARGEVKKDYCLWAHGSLDDGQFEAKTDPEQTSLMCTDCEDRCPAEPYERDNNPLTPAEEYLNSEGLTGFWNHPFYCAICDRVVEDPRVHRTEVHPFDADGGLEARWDMRRILPGQSEEAGEIVTEVNGWNIVPGQLTRDADKAEQRKHVYYFEDIALSHCDSHEHTWQPYNGGPVQQCTDCYAYNLTEYDPADPGPPVTSPADAQPETLTPEEEEAHRIHKTLDSLIA